VGIPVIRDKVVLLKHGSLDIIGFDSQGLFFRQPEP
jgi:hypothetical protein